MLTLPSSTVFTTNKQLDHPTWPTPQAQFSSITCISYHNHLAMMERDVSQVNYSDTKAGSSAELFTPNATPASSTIGNGDVLLRDLNPLFTYLFSSDLMSSPSSPHSITTSATTAAATIARPMNDQVQIITDSNVYRDLLNRYRVTLIRVKDLIRENNALRQDNNLLRSAYEDLNRQFDRLFSHASSLHSCILSACSSSTSSLGSSLSGDCYNGGEFSDFSQTSVLDELDDYPNVDRFEEEDRLSLPKSISVRSSDYMNMQWSLLNNNSSHHAGDWSRQLNMNGSPTPWMQFDTDKTGRKRIGVEDKEMMSAAEMSISKQGMYKTELCNNWRQKGNCPYGMSCQFAHGVSELRPVIRHQKYKSEVCRMILTIGRCPYGHRCHFRHSLTQQ